MAIKQHSVEQVRSAADLTELVGRYTTVKQRKACCPFHNEKSPSFSIMHGNDRYKCFGCGKSGDAFNLIMEKENKTFYEAVEWLASLYHITLEYNQAAQQITQEQKDLKTECLASVKWAAERYTKALQALPAEADVLQYLNSRGYNAHRLAHWDIGFAPADNKFLTTPLINAGKHGPSVEIGLVNVKEGVTKDFFYNRIIIPIHDVNGIIVGLAGRQVPSGNKEADKKYPKYLNPKESIIYHKAKLWYGLWQAKAAIKQMGYCYITEGYMDVQAMHDAGLCNTVAACGTEVDILQLKMLKHYTNHLVLAFDGDGAGTKKMDKLIDNCLKLDFKTQVLNLPQGQDPDEFIRSQNLLVA
ncbi:DNA primase [Parasediminibacterium paludis]|uniref:DNA primase n=1 Tax=Parasediminibacterium paludis TaxID=908966 RepID=A0ABV8PTI5_9BACT